MWLPPFDFHLYNVWWLRAGDQFVQSRKVSWAVWVCMFWRCLYSLSTVWLSNYFNKMVPAPPPFKASAPPLLCKARRDPQAAGIDSMTERQPSLGGKKKEEKKKRFDTHVVRRRRRAEDKCTREKKKDKVRKHRDQENHPTPNTGRENCNV